MSADDDDALSWAGDESPEPRTVRDGRTPRRRAQEETSGAAARSDGPVSDDHVDPRAADAGQLGSVALVLLGLLGGVHLLYAVGWATVLAPLQAVFGPTDVLGAAMFSLGLVFAAAAPIVWFLASFWFTRSRPVWQRIAALIAGAVLLVPWPLVVGVQ
jgi:hypothetical protein